MDEKLKCRRKPENTYEEEIFSSLEILKPKEEKKFFFLLGHWNRVVGEEKSRSKRLEKMPQNNRKRIFYDRMRHQNMLRCSLSSSTRVWLDVLIIT